jgi:tetratricopeptide (TPR) repeat protein
MAAVERDPKNDDWQLALSNAHFYLGDVLRHKGDHAGTLLHFRKYLDISTALAAQHPGDSKYEAEVSYGHGNVGAAYEAAGNLDGALAEFQIAVELDRRRLQREPRNDTWRKDLAVSLNRVGVVLQKRADLAAARRAFTEELALQRQLVAAAPNDAKRLARLAVTLGYTGLLQKMMGDTREAFASYREELDVSAKLAALDPGNLTQRRNQLMAQLRLAGLMTDDPSKALALTRETERGLRAIVKEDPRPLWLRDLAGSLHTKGLLSLEAGNAAAARAAAREAIALLDPLDAADPRNPQNVRLLCDNLLLAADAEEWQDHEDAARDLRRRVMILTEGLTAGDVRVAALRARAMSSLGYRSEASAEVAKLIAAGYRDVHLDLPPPGAPPGSSPPALQAH